MPLDFKFGLTWVYGDKKGSFTMFHQPFLEAIKDWAPAFEEIAADVLEPHVKAAFDTEGSSEGLHWKDLAPATVKRRGSAHPILRVTGALERSFEKGGADHIEQVSARRLTWGSMVPTALFHEFGTRDKVSFKAAGARYVLAKTKAGREGFEKAGGQGGGIPARPMIVYSRAMAKEISSVMLGRISMVARQIGYKVGGRAFGHEKLTPLDARMIGKAMLANQG